MATTKQLQNFLDEPRNGCNAYIRHPLVKKFIYTDGVQEMAKLCGAYWLLDIIVTEAVPALLREFAKENGYNRGIVSIKVDDAQVAVISLAVEDDALPIWARRIEWTDFPIDYWPFLLGVDQVVEPDKTDVVMSLIQED